ncbi:MAG: carboxymuconolactone decarboxylase family protein [Pyrinomonadaceae bacterium]
MSWIKVITYEDAGGKLLDLYDRIKGRDDNGDNVDNIMLAHSLRPHTLEGHMLLYKYVLHHPKNTVAGWFLEAVGVYVSMLTKCDYCIEHHCAGMGRLLNNDARSKVIREAFESGNWESVFGPRESAALKYAGKLTEHPSNVTETDIQSLREAGWEDGEILEINQVTSYFAYANRTVLGLGINTDGDILGLAPSDSSDLKNWRHQ